MLFSTVAMIGFEYPSYTVLEGSGNVTVCVSLVEGELSWPVTFRIYSSSGTATGKHSV